MGKYAARMMYKCRLCGDIFFHDTLSLPDAEIMHNRERKGHPIRVRHRCDKRPTKLTSHGIADFAGFHEVQEDTL